MKIDKNYLSAIDIANLNLENAPKTPVGVRIRAEKEGWNIKNKNGKGGGIVYDINSMPENLRVEILEKTLISEKKQDLDFFNEKEVFENCTKNLTERQRLCVKSRLGLVNLIEEIMLNGKSKKDAIFMVLKSYKTQLASQELRDMLENSSFRAINKNKGLSVRTLEQFMSDAGKANSYAERIANLTPVISKDKKSPLDIPYMSLFLEIYQNPNGISFTSAYEQMVSILKKQNPNMKILKMNGFRRNFMNLPQEIRLKNRLTGGALKEKQAFIRRDWSVLKPNDCWVGDGHAMKLKVEHPNHGRPFTPELTLIIDAASRMVTGWGLSLSENALAIREALRNGVEKFGIPAIYYSDNGGGQANSMLDDPAHGTMVMLGIKHTTGIPGNPQARGIIERLNKTLALKIAQKFETFYGKDADPTNVNKTLRAVNSYDKALRNSKSDNQDLSNLAKFGAGKLPSWAQLLDAIQKEIDIYNNTVHSSINQTPVDFYFENLEKENHKVASDILDMLFMPEELRTTNRGEVRLHNNLYFNKKLIEYNSKEIRVAFDIANPSYVVCKDKKDGRVICRAELNGNLAPAFSKSFIEKAKDGRYKRRMALIENKKQEIEAENRSVLIHQTQEAGFGLFNGLNQTFTKNQELQELQEFEEVEEQEYYMFEIDKKRAEEKKAAANAITEAARQETLEDLQKIFTPIK